MVMAMVTMMVSAEHEETFTQTTRPTILGNDLDLVVEFRLLSISFDSPLYVPVIINMEGMYGNARACNKPSQEFVCRKPHYGSTRC